MNCWEKGLRGRASMGKLLQFEEKPLWHLGAGGDKGWCSSERTALGIYWILGQTRKKLRLE